MVDWKVHEQERAEQAAALIEQTCWSEKIPRHPNLVLHADNGSPMKGQTLQVKLQTLGIESSYSRPRVSNDNPYSEAIFRNCKYRPGYPDSGFGSLEQARKWVLVVVRWYNFEYRHSGIRCVTPHQRREGEDQAILAKRDEVYEKARQHRPDRWTGKTRNWQPIGPVWLNPEREKASGQLQNKNSLFRSTNLTNTGLETYYLSIYLELWIEKWKSKKARSYLMRSHRKHA